MIIQNNISSINSHRNMIFNNRQTAKNLEKLSSGFRINRAGDDAAGLAISEKMRGQIRGLSRAMKNIGEGIALTQTIDGAMQINHELLHRKRELLVQASNGTFNDSDRILIQKELDHLVTEIDDLSYRANFNGIKVLRGIWEEEIASNIPVLVQPWQSFAFGYVYIPSGWTGDLVIEMRDFVLNAPGSWPDLNVIAPNDEIFGFWYVGTTGNFLSGVGAGSTTGASSADLATNLGWGANEERFTFTNPIPGRWTVYLNNSGGSLPSSFTLSSNLRIVPFGEGGTVTEGRENIPIHSGANAREVIYIPITTVDTHALGLRGADGSSLIQVDTISAANEAIAILDEAINILSNMRAAVGAAQNRLEHALNSTSITKENLTAAEGTIRDTDMASELVEFTKNSILSQTAQAMLAQANRLSMNTVDLLR